MSDTIKWIAMAGLLVLFAACEQNKDEEYVVVGSASDVITPEPGAQFA